MRTVCTTSSNLTLIHLLLTIGLKSIKTMPSKTMKHEDRRSRGWNDLMNLIFWIPLGLI